MTGWHVDFTTSGWTRPGGSIVLPADTKVRMALDGPTHVYVAPVGATFLDNTAYVDEQGVGPVLDLGECTDLALTWADDEDRA